MNVENPSMNLEGSSMNVEVPTMNVENPSMNVEASSVSFEHSSVNVEASPMANAENIAQNLQSTAPEATPTEPMPDYQPARKRRRAIRKLDGDPANMMLGDLLFYNPPKTIFQLENQTKVEEPDDDVNNNPETVQDSASVRSRASSVAGEAPPTPTIVNFDDAEDKEQKDSNVNGADTVNNNTTEHVDESEQMLMFDDKGNIIIKNPQALQESQTKAMEKPRANAVRSMTTYNSFRKSQRSKGNWTTDETAVFYTALEIVGTDFSLMEAAFFKERGRTRKQLKQKFKREEKMNRAYVDSILFKSLTSHGVDDHQNDHHGDHHGDQQQEAGEAIGDMAAKQEVPSTITN